MPSKRDLVYVRVAENARLQPGTVLCNVRVEVSPGQLASVPSNQIYSFGKSGPAKPDKPQPAGLVIEQVTAGGGADSRESAAAAPAENSQVRAACEIESRWYD